MAQLQNGSRLASSSHPNFQDYQITDCPGILLFLVFHIFWILGHQCFPIRHHITYFTPNSFVGKFSGCDLGFFQHVVLLTWSNYGFDSQVEKVQWKRNISCSHTHVSLASRLKSRQRMVKYIHASLMLPRLKAKIIGEVIFITGYLSCSQGH